MKSNSFFSFNRFSLLMRNDILLNYKTYLLTVAVAFVVGYFLVYYNLPSYDIVNIMIDNSNLDSYIMQKYTSGFMMFLIGLAAFVGFSFPAFSSKTSQQSYLMVPSSIFEKYLSQFLIRIVLASMIFLIVFWIDAYLAREIWFNAEDYKGIDLNLTFFSYSKLFSTFGGNHIISLSAVMFIVAIGFYLFSVRLFFKKLAIFKTVISLVALLFVVFSIFVLFSHLFYPQTVGFNVKLPNHILYKAYGNMELWFIFILSVSWLFLLPLGYFKLKEKQL